MASVYDDIAGHELGWIREKLGLSIELSELKEAMDEIPWIVEVEDGIYSFSQYATPMVEYDRESLTRVLMLRYQNGMQFDSIDLEIFRETYHDIIGEELELTDKQLMTCLCKCGVMYNSIHTFITTINSTCIGCTVIFKDAISYSILRA